MVAGGVITFLFSFLHFWGRTVNVSAWGNGTFPASPR